MKYIKTICFFRPAWAYRILCRWGILLCMGPAKRTDKCPHCSGTSQEENVSTPVTCKPQYIEEKVEFFSEANVFKKTFLNGDSKNIKQYKDTDTRESANGTNNYCCNAVSKIWFAHP
jgi:hypothetical protein